MKKFLIVLMVLVLALGSVGCGESNLDSGEAKSDEPQLTAFEQFEKGLDEQNLTYEKVTMAADMVGAVEGYKYKLENGKAEIYKFDKDSEALKDAIENKSLRIEGFGSFPVEINGNYALINNGKDNAETITDIFESIK